ncbi:MAG: hypothetical protein ACYTHK_03600 [Planctomycetota bacterium]
MAALLTLGAGCGGGGGDIIENLDVAEQLEGCLADGTGTLLALNAAIGVLEDAIASESEPPEGIAITPVDGVDNAWDYEVGLDIDLDGVRETTISGRITFSTDPTDEPLGDGDTAAITFSIAGDAGVSGEGSYDLAFGELDSVTVWGTANLTLPDGCTIVMTIDEQAPLTYGGFRIPVADILGTNVFGTISVRARIDGREIRATLALSQTSNDIEVTNASIDGIAVDDFSFTLPLDSESLFGLFACSIGHLGGAIELTDDIIQDLILEITNPAVSDDVTITPSGPTSFTFVISGGGSETTTGSVSVVGALQENSTVQITLDFDWQDSLSGSWVRTRSGTPAQIRVSIGTGFTITGGSISGIWDCRFNEPIRAGLAQEGGDEVCSATVTIPAETALEFEGDLETFNATGGAGTVEGMYGGNALRLDFSLDNTSNDLEVVSALFNGIPLPVEEFFFD